MTSCLVCVAPWIITAASAVAASACFQPLATSVLVTSSSARFSANGVPQVVFTWIENVLYFEKSAA